MDGCFLFIIPSFSTSKLIPTVGLIYRKRETRIEMSTLGLAGFPIIVGFVGAPLMQGIMRRGGMNLHNRVRVEVALVATGALGIYLFPPGNSTTNRNWRKFYPFVFLVSLGVFTLSDGYLFERAIDFTKIILGQPTITN
jgi:hypothetical protein